MTFAGATVYDWAPDGQKIVYVDYRFNDWRQENGTLWLLNIYSGEKNNGPLILNNTGENMKYI